MADELLDYEPPIQQQPRPPGALWFVLLVLALHAVGIVILVVPFFADNFMGWIIRIIWQRSLCQVHNSDDQ